MDVINSDYAIVNLTRITVSPENRRELCQTISSLINPMRSEKGCLTYRFYEETGDRNTFVLIGEWETSNAWSDHLQSDNFAVLIGSLSLLCKDVLVDFKLLAHVAGIEAMTSARLGCHTCESPAT
jgi:quinol monooxygenase YgiN